MPDSDVDIVSRTLKYEDVCHLPGYEDERYRQNRDLVLDHHADRTWRPMDFDILDEREEPRLTKCVCSHVIKVVHIVRHLPTDTDFEVGTSCSAYILPPKCQAALKIQRRQILTLEKYPDAKFCRNKMCGVKLSAKRASSGFCKKHTPPTTS